MSADSSGNVGIGTTTPQTILNGIAAAARGVAIENGFPTLALSDTANSSYRTYIAADGGNAYFWNVAAGPTLFGTSDTERALIDSIGQFFVNKTTSSGNSAITAKSFGTDSYQGFNTNNAFTFAVSGAGIVYAVNTTISAISDQRLKENVQDSDVGLNAVMQLKPRKFDWKEGKGKNIKGDRGWVAQEFEQIFPDMIDEWRDPAPEGEEPYKSVRADLIPVLVKAIQELKAIVDAQGAEIAALKGTPCAR
jgi:hypothetical protein